MTADQSSGPAQAEPGKTAIRAAESELEFILSGLLTLLVGGTLYYVYSLFEALAPPWRLNLWAAGTGFVTVLMLATPLAYFAFRPGAEAIPAPEITFAADNTLARQQARLDILPGRAVDKANLRQTS